MKKKIAGFVLFLGLICLFGMSNTTYQVSNAVYTDGNIDLVGKQVSVRGITEGTFHILSYDGEKVRLLSDIGNGSFENFPGNVYYNHDVYDKIGPVAFEDSELYNDILTATENFKSQIELAGGNNVIYKVDAPTLDDLLAVGHFEKNGDLYVTTDQTPEWLLGTEKYFTKTIAGNKVYAVESSGIYLTSDGYEFNVNYGLSLRIVLETSIYNLISDDPEIEEYIDSLKKDDEPKQDSNDKPQIVNVPSTGMNGSIIFTIVGLAIIVIAGIVIWTIVKNNKDKKN